MFILSKNSKLRNKRLWIIGLFVLAVVALPLTVFFTQQQQDNRSSANKTVILSYTPASSQATPMQIPAGSTFTLEVYVDPGGGSVSYVKAEMLYDPSKFELAGGFIPNQEVFSQIVESPITEPGKIVSTLSIGSDLNKALRAKTQVGTLTLRALNDVPANTESLVSFGSESQALSVDPDSQYNENVIANTLPATVIINKSTSGLVCTQTPSDTMLVIDRSGSMNERAGTTGTKLSSAKVAANNFVTVVAKDSRNTIGLSSFASSASLNSPLTSSSAQVTTQINALTASGGTCIECGILKANQEITAKKRTNIKNAVILLTDGEANYIAGSTRQVTRAIAEQKALEAAKAGYTANDTIYFTVGLGNQVNSGFLTKLAESTGGLYFYSPTTDQLNSIYTQISQMLAKGSIGGKIFNDSNGNGIMEANEIPLPGWNLQLYVNNSQTPQLITTDSTGTFTIAELCDGTYTLKQVLKTGWKQTTPVNPKDYTFTLKNGDAVTNRNFGNILSSRCADIIDNDGNGFADRKDATCHIDGNPNNPDSYNPELDGERAKSTCSDSQDNNHNGKFDGADASCHTDGDPTNPDSYDPTLQEGDPTSTPIPTASPSATMTPEPTTIPTSEPTASPTADPTLAPTLTLIPTFTPAPTRVPPSSNSAQLALDIILHGIGAGGDNTNRTLNSLSNKNPLHPVQIATAQIFNASNQLTATASGEVVYSSESGSFKGIVFTEDQVPTGPYLVKVTIDRHLTTLIPGIRYLGSTQTVTLPTIEVVTGDITRDNQLDIRDYNKIIDCYSDIDEAPACADPQKKADSDINDDGTVGQIDYNLFLRELSTQAGE